MTTSRDAQRGVTRYVCPTTTSVAPCKARATIRADRADEVVVQDFMDTWGPLTWFEEKVTVVGGEVDEEERAVQAALADLTDSPTPEALAAYQAALAALDEARAQPVIRTTEIVATDTYANQWIQGGIPERQALLRLMADQISIAKASGPVWEPTRIKVTWVKDVE